MTTHTLKTAATHRRLVQLLAITAWMIVSMISTQPTHAQVLYDCSETTLSQALWAYTSGEPEAVLNVQRTLGSMGFDPRRDDGIIGPDTLAALRQYCRGVNTGSLDPSFSAMLERLFYASAANAMDGLGVVYVISEAALTELQAQSKVIDLLQGLKGQAFPSKTAFEEAIAPQLIELTGEDNDKLKRITDALETAAQTTQTTAAAGDEGAETPQPALPPGSVTLPEAVIPTLISELQLTPIPDDILAKLEPLMAIEYPNAVLLEHGIRAVLQDATDSYFPAIANATRVVHDFTQTSAAAIKGGSCGCARNFDGVVYGFHPFWLGNDANTGNTDVNEPTSQTIAFGILNRLGYFALSLDQEGNLGGPGVLESNRALSQLSSLAHRYKSKVDIVIYNNDWSFWPTLSDKRKDIFFDNLRKNIISLLQTRSDTFADKAIPYISFGTHPPPTLGDGVTLYFDKYPDDDGNFFEFIKRLRADLDEIGQRNAVGHYFLNLMLSTEALGEGVYAYEDLKDIIPNDESTAEDYVDLLIMHLNAPTTDTKKALRNKVENGFKGIQRRNVLRKIVPVITPIGHQHDPRGPYQQFFDDLVYFQDNFAGVGFWPVPSEHSEGFDAIKTRLIDVFGKDLEQDMLERLVTSISPEFCQFACPNRWAFRIVFDIIVASLLLYGLFSITNCRLKSFYRKYVIYFAFAALAAVAIILILLACDPFWNARADDVAFTLLALIVALVVWRYVRKMMQGPLP